MIKKLLFSALVIPAITSAQFSENFDASTSLPSGWTALNGGDTNTWSVLNFTGGAVTANSGTNAVCIRYGSTAHNDILATPAINVVAGVNDGISFYARSRDPLYPEVISLKISTVTPTLTSFTTVLASSIAPASGANFYKYTFDLSAYAGQTIYIGFHSTTTDMFYFDIDDVVSSSFATLGTTEIAKSQISLYPNPTQDFVTINSKGRIENIQFFNQAGQLMKSFKDNSDKLDIRDFTPGIYLLKLNIEGKTIHQKIIKE